MKLVKLFLIAAIITAFGYLLMGEQKTSVAVEAQTASPPVNTNGEIAVTKFDVSTKLESGNRLLLKLDSDAPDNLNLYVMVYRTYKRLDEVTNKPEEEYLAYHETQLTAGELKAGKSYVLDHAAWKKDFANRQAESSRLNIKLLPKTISGNITITVGLEKNDAFGKSNERLIGAAVTKQPWGDKTLKAEKNITVPLAGVPKHVASLNPDNLDIGQRYITEQLNTPLMPHYAPANKMAAVAQTKQLPAGTPFKVLRRKVFNDEIWYEVSADFNTLNLSGWINSQALGGLGAVEK